MRNYKRLLIEDRKRIEQLLDEGKKPKEIAAEIGVHLTTIYNELRRCPGKYSATQAQESL